MDFNEKTVEEIKKRYPIGTVVELINMQDFQAPPTGTRGKVIYVDDIGSIQVKWNNGSGLALIPGVDSFRVIKEK